MENRRGELIVVLAAAAVYLGSCFAPPHLMDDVDAVQAQIARNMLESGDWVTARLNGVAYLEKAPLVYWVMAGSFAAFGVSDWAARLPLMLAVVALCWLTARFGRWAFGEPAGFYAGLVMSSCVGLWLFTRILIPDAMLTLAIAISLWAFLRALDPEEARPGLWPAVLGISLGAGLLLKGLIAVVFPGLAMALYLLITGNWRAASVWRRLHPWRAAAAALAVAVPWHALATWRNPPYFDFTLLSEPGQYRGFFWFYFLNEHVLRFLNMRHPRDYNTVPRHLFWLFHLIWLFPWSAYLPGLARLRYRGPERAGRTRLLLLCLAGVVMFFFTLSTTQEYYSMPVYPAVAMLLGCVLAANEGWLKRASYALAGVMTLGFLACAGLLGRVWNTPAPGDIERSLTQHPELYTLSLGHMGDLTLESFAYLKLPLAVAAAALLLGAAAAAWYRTRHTWIGLAAAMVLFFQAARLAMVEFDPYLSSYELAMAYKQAPSGRLVVDNQYYAFSSVPFYAGAQALLLLRGRVNNLEYGSYAPGAPRVFLSDEEFPALWNSGPRMYLLVERTELTRMIELAGPAGLHLVKRSGGKYLYTNLAP